MLRGQTTTKQEQDPEDTNRSNIGVMTRTEEETEKKIKVEKDTRSIGTSDNLHKNRNPPKKLEV